MTQQTRQPETKTAIIRYRCYEIKHSRRTDKWLAKLPDDMWIDGIQADSLKALKHKIDAVMTEVTNFIQRFPTSK